MLLAGGAAEREPGPRARCFAELLDAEPQELGGHRIDDERHDPPDVDGIRVRIDHRGDDLGKLSPRRRDIARGLRAFDRALHRERRMAPEPHQVGVRHDAGDASFSVGHGEVMHAVGEHAQESIAGQHTFADG